VLANLTSSLRGLQSRPFRSYVFVYHLSPGRCPGLLNVSPSGNLKFKIFIFRRVVALLRRRENSSLNLVFLIISFQSMIRNRRFARHWILDFFIPKSAFQNLKSFIQYPESRIVPLYIDIWKNIISLHLILINLFDM